MNKIQGGFECKVSEFYCFRVMPRNHRLKYVLLVLEHNFNQVYDIQFKYKFKSTFCWIKYRSNLIM